MRVLQAMQQTIRGCYPSKPLSQTLTSTYGGASTPAGCRAEASTTAHGLE